MPGNTMKDAVEMHDRALKVGNAMTSGCKAFFMTLISFFFLGLALAAIYLMIAG